MSQELFTAGWTVDGAGVRLPHDAMIAEPRSADAATGNHGGYFPGGRYVYAKRWTAPPDAGEHHLNLVFEGVYGRATVRVDGTVVARCDSGYREFRAPLDAAVTAGREHLVEVEVDNRDVPNSRWYTGSGIYRPVHLETLPAVHLAPDGIAVHTRELGDPALVDVAVRVAGPVPGGATVEVEFRDERGVAATATAPVADGTAAVEVGVPGARLWSHEYPHLYRLAVRVRDGAAVLDERHLRVGLRTVEVDARRGLLINGKEVLLQGACVHHDSGILGAATFRAAEFRRARILKATGFTAVRSSHNPLSRDLLDACDEVGLYVVDELTDTWFQPKTAHDLAVRFDEIWRDDVRAMVAKDRNHPSVIMYSIGNEIAETATARGVATARELHAAVEELDPHRPTTVAVNMLLNIMASRGRSVFSTEGKAGKKAAGTPERPSKVTSTAANLLAAQLGSIVRLVSRLPLADRVSRDVFAEVDVAGYNYAHVRYAGDRRRHPGRVILGSESMPGDIAAIWRTVQRVPGVIGDFMWTGWDYLGEAGIGTWSYGDEPGGLTKPYPALVAGCGAVDISGRPGAPALLARAVWGHLTAPEIAVRPLDHAGRATHRTPWRGSDAVQSWSWSGCEGRTAEVEVYTGGGEVELLLNGRSLGRRRSREHVVRFRVPYEPGELVAIGRLDGRETGRSSLRSAGPAALRLTAEQDTLAADGDDLAFVHIELADDQGTVEMLADDVVTVSVSGSATLAAVGSAAPAAEDRFTGDTATSHRGRALAVVRAGERPGTVTVTATGRRHGTATLELSVRTPEGVSPN